MPGPIYSPLVIDTVCASMVVICISEKNNQGWGKLYALVGICSSTAIHCLVLCMHMRVCITYMSCTRHLSEAAYLGKNVLLFLEQSADSPLAIKTSAALKNDRLSYSREKFVNMNKLCEPKKLKTLMRFAHPQINSSTLMACKDLDFGTHSFSFKRKNPPIY